ncbi:RNA polymerase sigma factor [Paraglaciecola sp.]|uniref:RNA polymerase sigma factor n=1 Tax=Paraglaciecola sp. TaxID=1920173 RepID=UPI0030F42558
MNIENLVKQATSGNKVALEGLTVAIQDDIYYLALRILVNPDDAMDATQDILIKVITNLSSFRFESKFKTWVYRLAANYLLSEKKVLNKDLGLTFDLYKMALEGDLQEPVELRNRPDYQVLLNELRISCTMAMLLCLKLPHRMAYILGDIMEMEHDEASQILSISKDNFRKQLSRARNKVTEFTATSCGLVSTNAKCSCDKKITGCISKQRVDPNNIYFSGEGQYSYNDVKKSLSETTQQLKTISMQKLVKQHKCPIELSKIIDSLVTEGINSNHH